ncbi:hypothetical protein [Aurantiacibacter rhizosphaerae]|uniref:SMP-30/Gluconolactonase/LRE-like region domain-containing protein n=1 Tax=Aurantiacibacter rhizosphaerae TaxID=2691582 RepID=A0A844XDJ3_9SPHN|nr:hypothetical protein [Aurantiacibacter rhizosphaerae]MWV27900.1 hypothetical protein [Aurantiacibacter rhizosphaerae]
MAWHPVDASTAAITDIAELESLAEAFPNSSSVRLRLLNALVEAEDASQALIVAEALDRDGYAFSPGARSLLESLAPAGEAPGWISGNVGRAAAIASSEHVATIPSEAQLPEGLAMMGDGIFAVTALISREVWFGADDDWTSVPVPGVGNISGIDSSSNDIVVASADLGMTDPSSEPFSGLIAIQDSNHPIAAPSPDGAQISDIAFFRDQVLYASDPIGGGVYRSDSVGGPIMQLVPPGLLRSPQGIAPSEDGSRLYVSDYRYGLAIVDTASGAVSRLAADEPMLLDGIDGLWLHQGELIAVQNGLSPRRIITLALSDDGNRITSLRVLEQANPEWTEPLGGDIHESTLYYIGNGSWDLFEEGGTLRQGAQLRATHIRRLDLSGNPTN